MAGGSSPSLAKLEVLGAATTAPKMINKEVGELVAA
jgi:hypothetical protein